MAAPKLTETALAYLEGRAVELELVIKARSAAQRGDAGARALEDAAFDAGERLEDLRRELGDAIIRADPQMEHRVRGVVKFPASR